jgi:hypothetical protein
MSRIDFCSQLESIATADSFDVASQELVDGWTGTDVSYEAVEPILSFMERYPEVDFGSPGALTHFVEHFRGREYIGALLASVERKPTEHTTWMLNRLINGERDETTKAEMIAALKRIAANANADEPTRAAASRFLSRAGAR